MSTCVNSIGQGAQLLAQSFKQIADEPGGDVRYYAELKNTTEKVQQQPNNTYTTWEIELTRDDGRRHSLVNIDVRRIANYPSHDGKTWLDSFLAKSLTGRHTRFDPSTINSEPLIKN